MENLNLSKEEALNLNLDWTPPFSYDDNLSLKENQLNLLEDSRKHYKSNNRCLANRSCRYNPKNLNYPVESDGCAIGRLIHPTLGSALDRIARMSDGKMVTLVKGSYRPEKGIFDLLPLDIQKFGIDFLAKLQSIHDNERKFIPENLE